MNAASLAMFAGIAHAPPQIFSDFMPSLEGEETALDTASTEQQEKAFSEPEEEDIDKPINHVAAAQRQ